MVFALVFYPWRLAAPSYKAAAAKGATLGLKLLAFDGENKSLNFNPHKGSQGGFWVNHKMMQSAERPGFAGEIVHYNMMILLALILASPGLRLKRRIRLSLIGAGILFLLHILQLAFKAEGFFARDMGPYSENYYGDFTRAFLDCVNQFFEVFGQQALPFAIWAILCVPSVLKTLRAGAAASGK